jgi:hypothetical protein
VPPPKAVIVAASRSGRLTAAATSPPITRLAAITAPNPAEAARFDTRLSGRPLAQLEHRAQEDLGEGRERLDHPSTTSSGTLARIATAPSASASSNGTFAGTPPSTRARPPMSTGGKMPGIAGASQQAR